MNEQTPACHVHHETTGAAPSTAVAGQYICPMHLEIVEDGPGDCPICGMALEPRTVTQQETNPEYDSMRRRLIVSTVLWSAAFLAYVISYGPMLMIPRPGRT